MDIPIDSTTNESDYNLFTIRQTAHACNVSRSSLIRMENKGLLTPAYTNAKSGYRYYDNDNINRILQIQKFQWMGFSPEEINAVPLSDLKIEYKIKSNHNPIYVSTSHAENESMQLRSQVPSQKACSTRSCDSLHLESPEKDK